MVPPPIAVIKDNNKTPKKLNSSSKANIAPEIENEINPTVSEKTKAFSF